MFGLPEGLSSEDWHLVIAYAHLAEGIGIEKLSQGVDEALLPASKERLRRILALAFCSSRTKRVLKTDDLAKLYGCLDLFLAKEDLDVVVAARAIGDGLGDQGPTEEQQELMTAALSIYNKAVGESSQAAERLKAHAASLEPGKRQVP